MVAKQLSIVIAIGICIGLGIARAEVGPFVAPTSVTKIDFNQAFSDVARQGIGYVDRAHKGDRLPIVKTVSPEPLLPNCEPVASPYADPILGRIVGRCAA